jgi:hypothetical protein
VTKLLALAALCLAASAQAVPADAPKLPAYFLVGIGCDQFAGCKPFVSGIVLEGKSIYGSVTMDLAAAKYTDAAGHTGRLLAPSTRIGQHRQIYASGANMLLLGGDVGASFVSPAPGAAAGLNISLAGSFTLTYARHIGTHWGIAVPLRMLWIGGAGPGGKGAWNPTVELALGWRP